VDQNAYFHIYAGYLYETESKKNYLVEAGLLRVGERKLEASATLYLLMRREPGVALASGLGVAGVPFVSAALDSIAATSGASFVGELSVSVGESLLRCSGVGVSGVDGLSVDVGRGVWLSPLVQFSVMTARLAGVLEVEDPATSSSDERFVCENDGEVRI